MTRAVKDRVKKATVRLPKLGGCGVLIPGNLIVTAAHCIDLPDPPSLLGLGDHCLQPVKSYRGSFRLSPIIVDLVSDIAVLAEPDNQEFYDDAEKFSDFCATTAPLQISKVRMTPRGRKLPVNIFTHKKTWLKGLAAIYEQNAHRAHIISESIKGGTSGSAIVTNSGDLFGIVSYSSADAARQDGLTPRLHLALPLWILRQTTR